MGGDDIDDLRDTVLDARDDELDDASDDTGDDIDGTRTASEARASEAAKAVSEEGVVSLSESAPPI